MRKIAIIAVGLILLAGAGAAETITIYTGEEVDIMAGDNEHTIELRAVTNRSTAAFSVDDALMEAEAGETFRIDGQTVPIVAIEWDGQLNGSMTINASRAPDGSDPSGIVALQTGQRETVTVDGEEYTLEPRAVTDGPAIALYVDGRLSEHEEGEDFRLGPMEVRVNAIEREAPDSQEGQLQLNMTGRSGYDEDDEGRIDWGYDDSDGTSDGDDTSDQDRRGLTISTDQTGIVTFDGQEYEIEPRAVLEGPEAAFYVNGELVQHSEGERFDAGDRSIPIVAIEPDGSEDGAGSMTINATGRIEGGAEEPSIEQDLAVDDVDVTVNDDGYNVTATVRAGEPTEAETLFRPSAERRTYDLPAGTSRVHAFMETTRPVSLTMDGRIERVGETSLSLEDVASDEATIRAGERRYMLEQGDSMTAGGHRIELRRIVRTPTGVSVLLDVVDRPEQVTVYLDPDNRIEETDEENNQRTGESEDGDIERPFQPPVERLENGSQPAPRPIDLAAGWNTISVQSPLDVAAIAEQCQLQAYQGELVWQYRGGEWSHPETLQPYQGYYVNAEQSCQVTYTPDLSIDRQDSLDLTAGWNMISSDVPSRADALRDACELRQYRGASLLSYRNGWKEMDVNERLDPETGYFVNVADACTLGEPTSGPAGTTGER